MNLFLQILGFALMLCGVIITYAAKFIVKKYNLTENIKVQFADQLTEKEEYDYRLDSAILRIKIIGSLVCLPGVLILFLIYQKIINV